jgi:hypothetical protein
MSQSLNHKPSALNTNIQIIYIFKFVFNIMALWKLKEETLDRTLWRTRFERGYGPVVRQITE